MADRLARRNPLPRWLGGRFGALPFFWPVTHGLQTGPWRCISALIHRARVLQASDDITAVSMITANHAIPSLLALALSLSLFPSNGEACTDDVGAGPGVPCRHDDKAQGDDAAGRMVHIERMTCKDGAVARWNTTDREVVTYKVNNWAGAPLEVALAVRRGVLWWNRVQPFYALHETADAAADITIEMYDDVLPGIVAPPR